MIQKVLFMMWNMIIFKMHMILIYVTVQMISLLNADDTGTVLISVQTVAMRCSQKC